jgi:orotate phosphoribosyltransferase
MYEKLFGENMFSMSLGVITAMILAGLVAGLVAFLIGLPVLRLKSDYLAIATLGLAEIVREYYPECEVLMGTSTAGIAHAAIVGHMMNLPMGYVRSSAKDHGRTNQIEGRLQPGQKVVVIEDLISTAGSAIDCVKVLREAGAEVLGVASIFTYGMQKGLDKLAANDVKNVSLCNLDALVEVAAETGYIKAEDKERILKFRDNPSDESWMKGDK